MKIGIFDPYLDTLGGGEKYMLTAATCLSSIHNVSVLWDKSSKNDLGKRIYNKFGIDIQSLNFEHNFFAKKHNLISRLKSSKKFDLIIFLSDGSIPLIATKLIVHFQFPVEWVKYSLRTFLKLKRIDKIICNSQFTKKYIDKKFGVKSTVLYPPVYSVKVKTRARENVIMNAGRFGNNTQGSSYKKQDVLVDAFKKMVKKGIEGWKLVLAVSTRREDEKALSLLTRQSEGYPIEIINNPDYSSLLQLYSLAKIYWHAAGYQEDLELYPERAEHFGIATAEAMTAGVVPVAINAGGQKEIIENGENGILWETTVELIEKTKMLINDSRKWEAMSDAAVIRSMKFNKENFCSELRRIVG